MSNEVGFTGYKMCSAKEVPWEPGHTPLVMVSIAPCGALKVQVNQEAAPLLSAKFIQRLLGDILAGCITTVVLARRGEAAKSHGN